MPRHTNNLHLFHKSLRAAVLGAGAMALVAGCGAASEQNESVPALAAGDRYPVAGNWIGYEMGLDAPRVLAMREVEVASEDAARGATHPEVIFPDVGNVAERDESTGNGLLVVDFAQQREYVLDINAEQARTMRELSELRETHEQQDEYGENEEPVAFDLDSQGALEPKVFGADERRRMGLADGIGVNDWPNRTFGTVGDAGKATCSGFFVDSNIIMTAAHCMFLYPNGSYLWRAFQPRRDTTQGSKFPYGSWNMVSAHIPQQFKDLNCHKTLDQSTCRKWDYAIVKVSRPDGQSWPGRMCVGGNSSVEELNRHWLSNRGYPLCGIANAPANCTAETLYGLFTDKPIVAEADLVDGAYATLFTEIDTSTGHSGSPVYVAYPSWLPDCSGAIIGVHEGRNSQGYEVVRRVTPALYDTLVALREMW